MGRGGPVAPRRNTMTKGRAGFARTAFFACAQRAPRCMMKLTIQWRSNAIPPGDPE
jgi:hypothetical protein